MKRLNTLPSQGNIHGFEPHTDHHNKKLELGYISSFFLLLNLSYNDILKLVIILMDLDFTFLDEEQISGDKKLDILKKYGTKCAITDFAILLGGEVEPISYLAPASKKAIGTWWTKSIGDNTICAYAINSSGDCYSEYVRQKNVGGRPVLQYSSISSLCLNKNFKTKYNNINEGKTIENEANKEPKMPPT